MVPCCCLCSAFACLVRPPFRFHQILTLIYGYDHVVVCHPGFRDGAALQGYYSLRKFGSEGCGFRGGVTEPELGRCWLRDVTARAWISHTAEIGIMLITEQIEASIHGDNRCNICLTKWSPASRVRWCVHLCGRY